LGAEAKDLSRWIASEELLEASAEVGNSEVAGEKLECVNHFN
jgi:hypothetical protein